MELDKYTYCRPMPYAYMHGDLQLALEHEMKCRPENATRTPVVALSLDDLESFFRVALAVAMEHKTYDIRNISAFHCMQPQTTYGTYLLFIVRSLYMKSIPVKRAFPDLIDCMTYDEVESSKPSVI